MKKLLTLIAFICFGANAEAQYVNIPDSNFRSFLIGKYPSCFDSAGQMDTSCSSIVNADTLNCSYKLIFSLDGLQYFKSLTGFQCKGNQLTSLPTLPNSLTYLFCNFNQLISLPILPNSLTYLYCGWNKFTSLPTLPNSLTTLICDENHYLNCLPILPKSLTTLFIDTTRIKCISNLPNGCIINNVSHYYPLCNPINNPNGCVSFPIMQGNVYADMNTNNKWDIAELGRNRIKVSLSNGSSTFTQNNGFYEIAADSIGAYTVSISQPNLYNAQPIYFVHNFNRYDTLVQDTFALQPAVIKDSLSIKTTALNFAARPGFQYAYKVSYENVGTTVLSPIINFNYDANILTYDSSSNGAVTNVGNSLNLTVGSFVPGQNSSFIAYFKVKTTATLGSNILAVANINAANITAADSVQTNVRGSFDPNDKQATPYLTQAECADDTHFINYTVRFQNTGTDTAFTVVVADTLSNLVQPNTLQLTSLSHNCKVTVNDKTVYFEFTNINLPDSNVNKMGSNGFVSFKVKPLTTLTTGTIVHNKATIYFDYNEAVITNTAKTIIGSPLPLNLINFNAIQQQQNRYLVYWNTENEINTKYFVIEQSTDAKTFIPIAEVAAKGFGNNNYHYQITKYNTIYLRLRIVDKNGATSYSKIIKLQNETIAINELNVVENPAKQSLKIINSTSQLNNTKANIVTAQGVVVKTFIIKEGYQNIDISDLKAGIYFLQTNLLVKKFFVGN